jgi:excisionase family DNA binding protein
MNKLVAFSEVARALGVSIFTVRRLADAGYLKSVYVGARRLVPVSEIERVIAIGAGKPRTTKAKRHGSR